MGWVHGEIQSRPAMSVTTKSEGRVIGKVAGRVASEGEVLGVVLGEDAFHSSAVGA
jgi:hypothetical protein